MYSTIYSLNDPRTGECRYIGRTSQPITKRLIGHITEAKRRGTKTYRSNWIRSLLPLRPDIQKVLEVPNHRSSEWEMKVIAAARLSGIRLTNLSDGGEGFLPGHVMSPEVRAKISSSLLGRKKKPFSDQHCDNISKANRGKNRSLESVLKTANSNRGKKRTDETKRKMSISASLVARERRLGYRQPFCNRGHDRLLSGAVYANGGCKTCVSIRRKENK